VRNPYARENKVEVHTQLLSRQVLTPKPFFNNVEGVARGHAYDTNGSVALTPHNPKQLFQVQMKHTVSIFHMKNIADVICFNIPKEESFRVFALKTLPHQRMAKQAMS